MMKRATFALIVGSTFGFVFLGLFFGMASVGSLYLWLGTGSYKPLLNDIIFACVALLAITSTLFVIVTGALQIRIPRPRLTRVTICLTLGWPIFTFGTFAVVLMVLGAGSEFRLSYNKTIAGDCLQLMACFLGVIGLALLLPTVRNGPFRYQRNLKRHSPSRPDGNNLAQ